MAGDWIKFDCDLPEKPEVWELADRVDLDPDAVVGKLLRVWRWFDSHTEDGNAPTVTKRLLDREVGVSGFADAMCQVGWLNNGDNTISVPNFSRHNGKTAKTRALTAKRVAEHKKNANGDGNAEVTEGALPREEKRREKKDNVSSTPESSRFAEFWEVWPSIRKRDRKKAQKVWERRKLDRMADTIIADVRKRQAEDNQWLRGYVPLPTTYLNGDRWEDVIEPPSGEQETNNPFAGAL